MSYERKMAQRSIRRLTPGGRRIAGGASSIRSTSGCMPTRLVILRGY
jgi:hypothetical protein